VHRCAPTHNRRRVPPRRRRSVKACRDGDRRGAARTGYRANRIGCHGQRPASRRRAPDRTATGPRADARLETSEGQHISAGCRRTGGLAPPRQPRERACPPGAPRGGRTVRDAKTSCPERLGPVRHRIGRRVSVNGIRETDRPTITERLRLGSARPADRRSAQPNIEIATDVEAALAAAGSHGRRASVAAARPAGEVARERLLDTRRGM
jgi:hypothetical protein